MDKNAMDGNAMDEQGPIYHCYGRYSLDKENISTINSEGLLVNNMAAPLDTSMCLLAGPF